LAEPIHSDPPQVTPLKVLSAETRDADDLAERIRAWDLDFRPVAPPVTAFRMLQVASEDVLISRVRLGAAMLQAGGSPPGMRTFGLLDAGVAVDWCGRDADSTTLLSFGCGESYQSVSAPGFGCFTVSVSDEVLDRTACALGLPDPAILLGRDPRVVECEPGVMASTRLELERIEEALGGESPVAPCSSIERVIDCELPTILLEAAAVGRGVPERSTSAERRRILACALEYLRDHAREAPGVHDLCEISQCNERTLRRAFLERFGISPRVFMKSMRLNGVRRGLRAVNRADALVADEANAWGFWHMGAFSADYRRLFGELPSETLRRGRR
jgi:AraC-like DNA-binding protein